MAFFVLLLPCYFVVNRAGPVWALSVHMTRATALRPRPERHLNPITN